MHLPAVIAIAALTAAAPTASAGEALAIIDVTVLPMTEGTDTLPASTVAIVDGTIASIGPAADALLPVGARRIDGTGKFLIPGLMDMHMHFVAEPIPDLPYTPADVLLPYFAHGVTQVLDMSANPHSLALAATLAAGGVPAPRIATAAMVDGNPPIRPGAARVIDTPERAREAASAIAAEGYDFIKVYSALDLPSFTALLERAQREDIRVVGHIPGRGKVPVEAFLQPGFAMVAHAEEFSFRAPHGSEAELEHFVDLARRNGTALTSTLVLDEVILAQARNPDMLRSVEGLQYVNPVELVGWFGDNRYTAPAFAGSQARIQAVVDFNPRVVAAMHAAGVPVMAGTDAIIPGLVPGLSLHQELQALVRAGLTPMEALAAATRVPAEFLGIADEVGTIEVGKRADLVLLDADPRADIANTRTIAAVIAAGGYYDRTDLDARMAGLAAIYAAVRPYVAPAAEAALAR